jgi:hypothetical protein
MITAPHQFLSCSRPSIEPKQKQTIQTCIRNEAQAAIGYVFLYQRGISNSCKNRTGLEGNITNNPFFILL